MKKQTGISTLLKRNLSKGQLIGYSFANLVGLTVILAGLLFYCDSRHHRSNNEDKYFSDDYIIVSKKVKGINLKPSAFTDEEIKDLEAQSWVKKLGKFTTADFSVSGSVSMGGKKMSSYLFFEAVPDEFFDKTPSDWAFDPEKKFVPIVLNKDYLALYNFGFAMPQGLPQLSEEMIGTIPLNLFVTGRNGETDFFDAAVVGFSSRLNTIAVPQDFLDWANANFSDRKTRPVSRLILKIDRLDSSASEKYMEEHGLEIAGDKDASSKVADFFSIVSGVVAAIGFVIVLLALFILLLSISLLLQKSRPMLRNLLLLGYSPRQASKYYVRIVLLTNAVVTSAAVGLTFVCRLIWQKPLTALGLGGGNVLFMLGAALIYFILFSLINVSVIRKHMLSIWKSE